MSVTASTTTQLPAVPSAAPAAASREPDDVEYPEGRWIAQSVWHGVAVGQARAALENHFRRREDVLVAMELVVYYERGNPAARLQPDVLVVFGVDRSGDRGSFRVWKEGKAPDFVLEVASPSTAGNDARDKARKYARIGVREYWRLDPKGSLMETSLEGYVATAGRFRPGRAPVERGGTCAAGCWDWTCGAGGGTVRRCWSSATRGRGRSSTARCRNPSGGGGLQIESGGLRSESGKPQRIGRARRRA